MSSSLRPSIVVSAVAEAEELIGIARIVRPQGRRGEVVADLLTDFPDRFAQLDTTRVKRSNGEVLLLKLESFRLHKGRVVLKFAGYDSIDEAEELRDTQVMIPRHQLMKLPEGAYYDFDLLGCEVATVEGRRVGSIAEIRRYGAAPLLAVKDEEGRERLIPLVLSICVEIDIERKRIVIDPPEGLLEL